MNKTRLFIFIFMVAVVSVSAQDESEYRKNAVSFNLTRYLVNEINISFEHRFSIRRGIEFNAGLIYQNEMLKDLAKDWVNTQYFYERGFAARVHYKIFKRKESDETKWRDYISPGISYKYLYYNNQLFENKNSDDIVYESLYQHRFRSKISLEFLWGKVYEMNHTFAFELYYGAGLTGTLSNRFVVYRQDGGSAAPVVPVNDGDKTFYVRPAVLAGAKLRISF